MSAVVLAMLSSGCCGVQAIGGVQVIQESNVVRVQINGELFTEYHYQDAARPYFYPVIGPEHLPMTRNWPMESPQNEEHDHPHHRSLWFAHGSVNGMNFWSEEKPFGKIIHTGFKHLMSGPKFGVIESTDDWVAPDGSIVCSDERTMRIYDRPGMRLFDFEVTIHASHGPVTFGDTKEGTMAIRLAETMRLKGKFGSGHIVTSAGARDEKTWGKRADWCDYYGPVEGRMVGVAIFDNPQNPRHPTTWHVRDYGLFAANPFGLHEFEHAPAHAGDFMIPAGGSATFRYRFYIHEGDERQAEVARMYADYVRNAGTP